MVPIPQAHDIKAMGSLPRIFNRDQTQAKAFLTEFLGYLILNQGVAGFESPIRQVTLALTLIRGEKVDLWIHNMIDSLRRLHPVHHNVPTVWEEFEQAFKDQFVDSTHKLRARNQLEQLKFKYPDIDEYIANFEDLIVHMGYNLASKEAINLFLKGFSKSRNLLDKVFTPPVSTAYGAMKRCLIAIVKSMQLVN
jgi:truncated hemoglobin YjbI